MREPVFSKIDFSPDSSKIFIVASKEKTDSDADNTKYTRNSICIADLTSSNNANCK